MKKRLFASLLCLALCLGLLPGTAWANGDGGVEYIERGWDGSAVTEQPKTIDTYTTITSDTIQWNNWNNGWYVAQGEVTIGTDDNPQRVTVTGDVHLILTDGCTLTVNGGIQVEAGNSLTIYGQSDGADTMGKLTASITSENTDLYNAAIGGNAGETGGTLTVYGGAVEATVTITNDFGSASETSQGGGAYGAAIGGGGTKTGNGGNGGTATVYGGAVEATVTVIDVSQSDPDTSQEGGAYGAAIGGGGSETGNGGDGGTITIFGGTVRAESSYGAGIGGGSGDIGGGGIGGNITISGGTVRAESTIGAGIGGGSGGGGGDGGKVTISGGAVWAESNNGGGIGGGGDGNGGDAGGNGGTITISGGTVEVQSASGAGIGGGSSAFGFSFSGAFPTNGTGGSGGTITISGGSVTATTFAGHPGGLVAEMSEGIWAGAAIGGGSCGGGSGGSSGTITISGGIVTAIVSSQPAPGMDPDAPPKYSAGIGNGAGTGVSVVDSSNITISGGTVFAQSPDGAGIGDGQNNDGSAIVIAISGGTVEAVSTNGAGIGGGMIESLSGMVNFEKTYSGGEITISGGSVSAQSTNGAGIGSGAVIYDVEEVSERNTPEVNGGEITVSGGTVSAQSVRGAGIGGGSGQVTVGSNVTVASGHTSPSLTLSSGSGGTVTISGGTVEAISTEGVGIGSGGMPFYQSESHYVDQYIHCVSGKAGTFTTGPDGNAMLFATGRIAHIEDDDDTPAWQGVIFLGSEGQLYGTSVTLSEDVTIPSGNTLEIGQGQTLSVGRGVTMTIDNENCLTGGGTLGHNGGSYEILNPLPVFTPTTLFYTGSDLSGRLSLTAPAGSVSIMGQIFTVSGTPTYRDWVITLPAGGILQVGTYTVTAYSPSQGRTVSGQITVIGDSSSTPTYSVILPGRVEGGTVTAKKSYAEEGETFRFTVTPDEGWELDTLSVTDNRGTELDVKYEGDSVYSFKMPARRVEIQVSFREIPPESLPFTDIADNAWYADAVRYVYEHGLMAGTSATTFAPDATTSRSMIATILWRMAGSPVVNYAMDYTDVAQGQWYSEAIRWAASEGIVGGYGNGLFGTNDPITREQFAVMLYRFAQEQGYDVSIGENTNILSYTDVADLSEYAISAMQWAVGAGIINGTGDGSTLSPHGQATRAQAAVMLMRFCEEYVTW